MEYKVLLVDQRKMIKRLLLAILVYLIVYGLFVLFLFQFNPSKELFLPVTILMLLLIFVLPWLMMRAAYYRETITLNEHSISTVTFGEIELKSIQSIKQGGNSVVPVLRLTLENHFKLMIMSPYKDNFLFKDRMTELYLAILRNSRKSCGLS